MDIEKILQEKTETLKKIVEIYNKRISENKELEQEMFRLEGVINFLKESKKNEEIPQEEIKVGE